MIYTEHLTNIFLILIVSSSLINYGESSEAGNWLTKSLDYYSLEKCSPLDKSGITGDFHACLNSPVDSSSSTGSTNSPLASGQGKPASGNWGKFGSTGGVGGFGSSGGFNGKSSFNGFTSSQSKTSSDSWPLSLVNDLQHMINCFPKLIKPCMTESEVQFFNTINGFFQAQVNYALPNASLIAARIASIGCVQSNSIDTNTICYSTNIHKQNWFGWKINWADGQMCRLIDDISKCELSSFDKCPSDVRQFADGLWEAGLEVTPCLDEIITTTTTTLSSPLPITVNPVNQTKSLAPGSSVFKVDPNQLPSHLTNVTNINSNDQQSLEVTVNDLTVNKYNDVAEAVKEQNEEDTVHSKPLVPAIPNRSGFFGRIIKNNEFDQRQQLDDNNENENDDDDDYEDGSEIDHKTRDFKGEMKHSKLVRLHEVDGEGESRHDYDIKHRDIAEEQWSRIKEEFRRKMRESTESRESDESEYEEESEESDEDKNFDIFENREYSFGPRSHNQEDDYRDNRKDVKDTRGSFGNRHQQQRQRPEQEQERQRKRNEVEARRQREEAERKRQFVEENSKRVQETERRNKDREESRREQEERQREDEERRRQEEERREEENERRLERERENARRLREDENDEEKIVRRPMRPIPMNRRETNKSQRNVNDLQGYRSGEYGQFNMRDCIESTFNSWPSLAENHKSDDIMDLMCRNMDSIHSCLDKHPATIKSNGQARLNRLGHLKMIYQTLCDPNNRSKESQTIERVRQCLTDHNSSPSSSSGSTLQTKYPNGISSRLWH